MASQAGDRVVVDPNSSCESCQWCEAVSPQFCESNDAVGVKRDGGWSVRCRVPTKQVILTFHITRRAHSVESDKKCLSHIERLSNNCFGQTDVIWESFGPTKPVFSYHGGLV